MSELVDVIIKSGTFLFVAISTGLAIKIYFRNKKVELENSLFKARLDAIGNIQMEMVVFFQHLDRIKLIIAHPEVLAGKNKDEEAFKVDDQLYKCQASIAKYSVYFTILAAEKLDLFVENFLGEFKGTEKEQVKSLENFEIAQLKYAVEALTVLRNESGMDEIHKSLMDRFKREKKLKASLNGK